MATDSDLDWTFEEIPGENEPPPDLARPARHRRRARARVRVTRRLWLPAALVLALAVGVGAGAYAFTRQGWQRLEAQLRQEIEYEDAQARAGAADAVRAVQAASPAWQDRRAEEAEQGLAAARPLPHLLPVDQPPQLLSLTSAGGGIFHATVVRAYVDAAGRPYTFTLLQRYRNLGPGLWERLPPDEAGLDRITLWQGQRLSVQLPVDDAGVLRPVLAQVDEAVAAVCAQWACPEGYRLPLRFTGQLAEQPRAGALGGPWAAERFGRYPLTFDLAANAAARPGELLLPSLHLAGAPLGAEAEQALAHAVTVQALAALADELAGHRGAEYALVREALAARAEIFLGLSPVPTYTVGPARYRPPEVLWHAGWARSPAGLADDLADRLHMLAFFNFALRGQTLAADGALLRAQQPDLAASLAVVLGQPEAERVLAAWTEDVARAFEAEATVPWAALDGLTYACGTTASMVQGGQPAALPLGTVQWARGALRLAPAGLSADGRYLAVVVRRASGPALYVLDWQQGPRLMIGAPALEVLGWSADNVLVYLRHAGPANVRPAQFNLVLQHPEAASDTALLDLTITRLWPGSPVWSPDHRALALTAEVTGAAGASGMVPIVIRVAGERGIQTLAPEGHSAAFGANGVVAFAGTPYFVGGALDFGTTIQAYDLGAGTSTALVDRSILDAGAAPAVLSHLTWSPDGRTLAFVATGQQYGRRLFTVPAEGGPPRQVASGPADLRVLPVGFSADGRYLAYLSLGHPIEGDLLTVVDLQTNSRRTLAAPEAGAAWSPQGHLLALAGDSGLEVLDAATGGRRWVSVRACEQVAWYGG